MSKKMTFAEKLKMQKESSEESDSEKLVEEKVEAVEKPKKERKPRKKKTEEVVEEKVVEDVKGGAVEVPKKEKKPRKKKEVLECTVETEKPKPEKVKRPPSAYNLFVKEAYKSEKVQKLPPKERFAKVAELWHKQKAKSKK